jgi:hypothetical protein
MKSRATDNTTRDLRTEQFDYICTGLPGCDALVIKGCVTQAFWTSGAKETWTAPNRATALDNFNDMKERWAAER